MEYKYIVNPMTNRRVKADSVLGKRLIKNYATGGGEKIKKGIKAAKSIGRYAVNQVTGLGCEACACDQAMDKAFDEGDYDISGSSFDGEAYGRCINYRKQLHQRAMHLIEKYADYEDAVAILKAAYENTKKRAVDRKKDITQEDIDSMENLAQEAKRVHELSKKYPQVQRAPKHETKNQKEWKRSTGSKLSRRSIVGLTTDALITPEFRRGAVEMAEYGAQKVAKVGRKVVKKVERVGEEGDEKCKNKVIHPAKYDNQGNIIQNAYVEPRGRVQCAMIKGCEYKNGQCRSTAYLKSLKN